MLKLIKVTGSSLAPEYQEGDFVLVTRIPFLMKRLKKDDVVVFNHPLYGLFIKRIGSMTGDGGEVFVVGSHENSLDSRQFGTVQRGSLLGKVIYHSKPIHGSLLGKVIYHIRILIHGRF